MKKFKIKLILLNLVVAIFISIIVGIGIYYTMKSELSYYFTDKIIEAQAISSLSSNVNKFLLVVIPFMLFATVIITIIMLNRINDSLDYVSKNIDAIIYEDFALKIPLPKSKELFEIIEQVNNLKNELYNKLVENKNMANIAINITGDILREIENPSYSKENVAKLIDKLVSQLEKIQILANRVKT